MLPPSNCGAARKDDLCHGSSSVRIKGISKSFTLTVVYIVRG